MSRKYHPDANINNPNKAQAEEKFKENFSVAVPIMEDDSVNIIKSKYYGIIRGVTVGIAFLLQIITMVLLAVYLFRGFFIIYLLMELLSVLTVFALVNNAESYKMSWIIIILVLPVAGLFCILCGDVKDVIPKKINEYTKLNQKYLTTWSRIQK